MNSSQEETFRSLMDYFAGRRMRILTSNPPSYIRVEFGSWVSMSFQGSAKGEAEITITKRNGGSYVNFNFNFSKEYLFDFIGAVIGALLVYVLTHWMISSFPSDFIRLVQGAFNMVVFGGMILLIALVMMVAGYSTSLTKRKFIEEFNIFAQSLTTKA